MLEIKKMRCELGITQKELAEAADLDIRWIQKVESGEIKPENITVKKFYQLSKGLSLFASDEAEDENIKHMREIYLGMNEVLAYGRS